jgi:hypothetical protein
VFEFVAWYFEDLQFFVSSFKGERTVVRNFGVALHRDKRVQSCREGGTPVRVDLQEHEQEYCQSTTSEMDARPWEGLQWLLVSGREGGVVHGSALCELVADLIGPASQGLGLVRRFT